MPSPVATLSRTPRPAPELAATWPYALLVAAVLVVVDLVLRRLGAPRRDRRVASRLDHMPGAAPTVMRSAA